MSGLEAWNAASPGEAAALLRRCLDSPGWVERVVAERPYGSLAAVLAAAEAAWSELGAGDWRQALDGHPRLGGDDLERDRFAETRSWSAEEQAGVAGAGKDVRRALAEAQREYERRFGHVFLIRAAGRDAGEILDALRARMEHVPERELEVAAGELREIARLRLEKALGP